MHRAIVRYAVARARRTPSTWDDDLFEALIP
jgi:hypothetical protein